MAYGSGLGASFGVAEETSYGMYVAPTRFYAGVGNVKRVQSTQTLSGVAAGRPAPLDEVVTAESGTGRLDADVLRTGFGLLLKHIFGTAGTPAQQGGTAAYLQTYTWDDNRGDSLSYQVGIPDTSGTVRPYTGLGAKITSAEFACAVGEFLRVGIDFDLKQVTEDETLAAPSYPSGVTAFPFTQMAVRTGTYGAETAADGVKGVTLNVGRPQNTERQYAGSEGLKAEPLQNDFASITGSIDVDFVDKTEFVDRYTGHTATSLVWEFVGPTIAGAYNYTIRFTLPKVYFSGDIPEIGGPDVVSTSVPFAAFYDPSNGLITAEYISTDIAV